LGLSAHKAYQFLQTKYYERVFKAYLIIREKIVSDSQINLEKWKGIFEVDESFYGGKFINRRKKDRLKLRKLKLNKRGRGAKYTKQPVFGIYKRNGKVFLLPVPDTEKEQLERIIKQKIKIRSKVYSDKWKGYFGLVGLGYVHSSVNHGREEYVSGKVHINGMEGFWGLSKVNIQSYKGIRKKNLFCECRLPLRTSLFLAQLCNHNNFDNFTINRLALVIFFDNFCNALGRGPGNAFIAFGHEHDQLAFIHAHHAAKNVKFLFHRSECPQPRKSSPEQYRMPSIIPSRCYSSSGRAV